MKAIKHLSIGLKLNFVLIVMFGLLVISTTMITGNSVKRLALQVSEEHVKQEIERIQTRFIEVEQRLLIETRQAASAPSLVEAIDAQSDSLPEDLLAAQASFTTFDYAELVGADEAILKSWGEAALAGRERDSLIAAVLENATETTATIASEGADQPVYWLTSAVPVRSQAGDVIGVLLAARRIDEAFLTALSSGDGNIQLVVLHDGQILAHNLITVEALEAESLDEDDIARGYQIVLDEQGRSMIITNDSASSGQPYRPEEVLQTLAADPSAEAAYSGEIIVSPEFSMSIDGSRSTRVGYAPLRLAGGDVQAAFAVLIPEASLFSFQNILLENTFRVYTLFPLIVLGALAIFAQQTIGQRLKQLQQVTAKMTSGDYSQRSTDQIMDEIGDLARAFNDMSTRVQARDADLRELAGSLEQQVQERTAELRKQASSLLAANHELAQSRKAAEEASRLKNEFLATMSHELRTPLNAIIGFTQIILAGMTGELNEEQREYHKRIFSNSQNLMGLINEILDLSKIEAGRLELMSVPFNLRSWVSEIQSQISALADQKGLAFEVAIAPALPEELVGDPDRIKQIMLNLLSNAIKFTEHGSVRVNIAKHDGATWLIEVKDSGIGIPSHALEYIFDEFRQVDGTARRNYGGTGLGLAIVRNLTLMMGGNVRVKSEVGKGSIFTVVLPLIPAITPEVEPVSNLAH